jgi:hypothetical protein
MAPPAIKKICQRRRFQRPWRASSAKIFADGRIVTELDWAEESVKYRS